MTSAQKIASLPMQLDFSIQQINKLCREGELYGYKLSEGNFEPWVIPEDSFALYLTYNPILMMGFMEMDTTGIGDELMNFIKKVKNSFYACRDETYTLSQLSYIFDKPTNQISTWFHISSFLHLIAKKHIGIPILDVVKFLSANPNCLEALKERHKLLLANGDPAESAVRHILMLHAYYESNGHLN